MRPIFPLLQNYTAHNIFEYIIFQRYQELDKLYKTFLLHKHAFAFCALRDYLMLNIGMLLKGAIKWL